MLTAERFEFVVEMAVFPVIGAAGEIPLEADVEVGAIAKDVLAAQRALRSALWRLKKDPSLRRLAPDGAVTYNDPVLAVACSWASVADEVGAASAEGADLTNASLIRWALTGVSAWLHRNDRDFQDLAARVPTKSIRFEKPSFHIAIVGDAGYAGVPQQAVLRTMGTVHARDRFDVILHLGDTYFSGGVTEFIRNLLVPFSQIDAPLYTLCGNHDLYHGPEGYESTLKILRQPGRYFEIETPGWRVLCLDTSLGCAGTLRSDGKLDAVQLQWLNSILRSPDPRGIILMSHHFMISGWDSPGATLARQIRVNAKNRVFSWYWGHEHRCACYGRGAWGFYGASVGHGAFLEEWSPPQRRHTQPAWYPKELRCSCPGIKGGRYWPHGFLELRLKAGSVLETYHFEDDSRYERVLIRKEMAQ